MSEIDIFTLFPEAFDWFAAQRHVRNAAAVRPPRPMTWP